MEISPKKAKKCQEKFEKKNSERRAYIFIQFGEVVMQSMQKLSTKDFLNIVKNSRKSPKTQTK